MSSIMFRTSAFFILGILAVFFVGVSVSFASDKFDGPSGGQGGGDPYSGSMSEYYGENVNYSEPIGGGRTEYTTCSGGSCSSRIEGGGDRNGSGSGTSVRPCLTLPDLTVTAIGFATAPLPNDPDPGTNRRAGNFTTVAADRLDPGVTYYPYAVIQNIGCMSTDAITITSTGTIGRGGLFVRWGTTSNPREEVTGWYSYTSTQTDTTTTGGSNIQNIVSGLFGGGGNTRTTSNTPTLTQGQSTSSLYTNQLPFGENGGFPIRLTIDFDDTADTSGATLNPSTYINNHDRLVRNESAVVAFSPVVLPEGTHTFEAYVDVPGTEDPGNGCNAAAGCIQEVPQDNNQYRIDATAADPSINLLSYRFTNTPLMIFSLNITNTETGFIHDVTGLGSNEQVGLAWTGEKIQWNTCTGETLVSDGATISDFNGQRGPFSATLNNRYGDRHDRDIEEPAPDTYHLYTITCQSSGGTTVTASHIITNGAEVDGLILTPNLNNLHVDAGETIATIPFTAANELSPDTALDATYTFTIDGTTVDTGTIDVPAGAVREPFTADVNWTAPAGSATYPMEVCVDHPEQIGGARCDEALLNVNDSLDTCQMVTASYPAGNVFETKYYPADTNITHLVVTWTYNNSAQFVPDLYDDEVVKINGSDDAGMGVLIDKTEPTEDNLGTRRPYIKVLNGATAASLTGYHNDNTNRPMTITYENNCGGANNPTISANPTLVRQGEETELTWDPAGNVGCYFSENVPGSFDSSGPGTGRVEIYRTSRFTITCPGTPTDLSASVTVQVIPTLFET